MTEFNGRKLRCFGWALALLAWNHSEALAGPLEVRFYPEILRTYEVDAAHQVNGALLQNLAVINTGDEDVLVDRVELELAAARDVIQVHTLGHAELERLARKGAAMEKAGLLQKYAFQFHPDRLLGKGTTLAADPRLGPGAAILLGQRYFVFTGGASRLEVRIFGVRVKDKSAVQAKGTIALSSAGSKIEYLFPLAGRSFIATGQGLHQGHRWVVAEEFALDIARVGEGDSTHRGDGSRRTDYYAYGAEVLAAADGTVRAVEAKVAETDSGLRRPGEPAEQYLQRLMRSQDELLQDGPLAAAGNYVVLEHAPQEFSLYAHLVPGSITVKPGERVKAGQVIARLGHSGNSSEPHLHFQVMDGPDPLFSAGIPVRFKNLDLPYADFPRWPQSGDIVEARNPSP